jgi:PQQ-like domain
MARSFTTLHSDPCSLLPRWRLAIAMFALILTGCVRDEARPAPGTADHGVVVLPNSLVVEARPGEVRAIGADGKVLWSLKLEAREAVVGKLAAAANSTVYARTSSYLRALSPNGEWLWKVPLTVPAGTKDAWPYSPAAMTDSAPVLLVEGQKYRGYTLAGEPRWELSLDASERPQTPPQVAPDGRVYVSTDQSLYAIAPSGKLSWRLAR